jgi:hypothetical protein
MHHIRKALVAFIAVATLALPAGAFAASTSSSTTESFTVAATISLTAPATSAWAFSAGPPTIYGTVSPEALSGISTNNGTGLTISVTVDAFTGPATVATTVRHMYLDTPTGGAGLTKGADVAAGGFTNSTTSKTVASSTVPVTNSAIGVNYDAASSNFTAAGTYNSASHFTATTNP